MADVPNLSDGTMVLCRGVKVGDLADDGYQVEFVWPDGTGDTAVIPAADVLDGVTDEMVRRARVWELNEGAGLHADEWWREALAAALSTSSEEVRHGMMPGSHERMQGPECRCGRDWPCPDVAAPSTSSEEASSTSEARRGRLIPTGVDAFARCLACGGLLRELQRTEAVIDARCDDCGDETQRRTPARRRAAPFSTQQERKATAVCDVCGREEWGLRPLAEDDICGVRLPDGRWCNGVLVPTSRERESSTSHPYKRHRDDGWPYCPQCDEDELYSLAEPATVETIVGCYRCNWQPGVAAKSRERAS